MKMGARLGQGLHFHSQALGGPLQGPKQPLPGQRLSVPRCWGGHLAGPCYSTCPIVMRTAQLLPMLDGRAVPGK